MTASSDSALDCRAGLTGEFILAAPCLGAGDVPAAAACPPRADGAAVWAWRGEFDGVGDAVVVAPSQRAAVDVMRDEIVLRHSTLLSRQPLWGAAVRGASFNGADCDSPIRANP